MGAMSQSLGHRSSAMDALRGADLTGKVAVVTGAWCIAGLLVTMPAHIA